MALKPLGIVRSKRNCCVVGCSSEEAKNVELSFYSFPSRVQDMKRKEAWIEAVNRSDDDGNLWQPSKNSRVCSKHFVDGKKSDDTKSPSYLPSIFPDAYYEDPKGPIPSRWRKRIFKRRDRPTILVQPSNFTIKSEQIETEDVYICDGKLISSIKADPENCPKKPVTVSTIGCQTAPWWEQPPNESNILFCWRGGNDSSTQTEIYIRKVERSQGVKIVFPTTPKIGFTTRPEAACRACSSGGEVERGFMGYSDIQSDKTMRQLAGISWDFFSVLLRFIEPKQDGQPRFFKKVPKENRLLLFLMKIKLGLSFCALASMFHVRATTASTIFFEVLATLADKTKTWIVWPSGNNSQANPPETVDNFTDCRCIVDCIEIRSDTPQNVKDQLLMYSNYRDCFTVKFLIAVTPDGSICKLSKAYGGRASDSFVKNHCGILDLIGPRDLVLDDKNFLTSQFSKPNSALVTPPAATNPQLTGHQVNDTSKIVAAEILIKRAVQRIKEFRILDHFSADLLAHTDPIMHLCCVMANREPPLIPEDGEDD